jgi:hypothetical protein
MADEKLFESGRIYVVGTPVRGNWGIHRLRDEVRALSGADEGTELWVCFTTRSRQRLLIYHQDISGRDVTVRLLRQGFFHIFEETVRKGITREQLRRLLFDGTFEGQWQNPLSEEYLRSHGD